MKELYNGPRIDYEPLYTDVHRIGEIAGKKVTWEGDPWYEVGKSWFETCYINAGISGPEMTYKGPDAQKMLSDACINDVYNWEIGKCKHLVQLDQEGLIANHGLYMRDSEDSFRATATCPFPVTPMALSGKYDVQVTERNIFIFQFSGPKSLTILEKLTQQRLRDVNFLDFRPVTIPGIDADIEICRIGMSGTLAYELRGPQEFGPPVYDAAYKIGKEYGIKRMGWRDYTVNHTFGGFPQQTVHFEMACFRDPEFQRIALTSIVCTGSVDPSDERARYRTPVEVDWAWMAKFNHDFVGREALEKEIANPKRKIVSLEFKSDDIINIYASQFTDDPYLYMDMPCAEQQMCGGHQDYVTTKDGKIIGFASVPTYSSHYRKTIAHAIIDIEQIEDGKEVLVQWGTYGKKIKDIRTTITRFPYINDVMDNRDYDLNTVPSGI